METVNILWTGGWDSTFRVASLRERKVVIQPYYFKFGRKSDQKEIETVGELTSMMLKRPETKFEIKELEIYDDSNLDEDAGIRDAFKRLREDSFIGSQYVRLAMLSKILGDLELGIHKDDKAHKIIKDHATLKSVHSEILGDYFKIDQERTAVKDVIILFSRFRFPLLDSTKLEMKEIAEEEGFLDIMNRTWFCHHAVNGKPCGYCNPCIYTIQEGLRWRFSTMALARYYLLSGLKKVLKKR